MNWKQKIEAQIAEMHYSRQTLKEEIGAGADTWADTTQALLDEIERLRAALKRIESNIGFSKTFLQKIAREALKDE